MSRRRNAVSGKQIIYTWGLDEYDLSYLILKHDLTVLGPPNIYLLKSFAKFRYFRTDSERLLDIIQNDPWSLRQKLFLLSEVNKIAAEADLLSKHKKGLEPKVLYNRKDVPPAQAEPRTADTNARDSLVKVTIEDHESEIRNSPNVFSLIGKVWFVKFEQEEWGLYPDQEKYKYIANLLSLSDGNSKNDNLEYSIYNFDLMAKVKGKEISEEYASDELEDWNVSDFSEELTSEELKNFKQTGNELLETLKEVKESNDQNRIDEAQHTFDKYRSYLFNEYGIKSLISKDETEVYLKPLQRSSSDNEKVRQRVKNQINNAIKDFKDHMPMFGRHLRHSVKTKLYETLYSPENHIAWHISI